MDSTVTSVESFWFLGTTISQYLKWDTHIDSIVKKAQQRLYLLRQLRKFNLPQEETVLLCHHRIRPLHINNCLVQLSYQIWPRRVNQTAEQIIGTTLPSLQELYSSRMSKRAGKITLGPSHPAHSLFELLPSGRRYRARSTRTTRHRNTVSSLMQSISSTLDIKHGTHNTIIHYSLITHTYFFI